MPKVSVIIPTYNQAELLADCLDSVFAQSFGDFEVLVVNNFSTDDTGPILDRFVGQVGDRLKRVDFANQGSIAAGRNRGAALARGEWLAFLDSDDLWEPEKLAVCLEAVQTADFCCHPVHLLKDGQWIGEAGRLSLGELDYKNYLFSGNKVVTSTVMVKRAAFVAQRGFNEAQALITAEDWDLWLRLVRAGAKPVVVDRNLGQYRLHGGSSSNKVRLHFEAGGKVFLDHYKALPPKDQDPAAFRKAQALHLYGAARKFSKLGQGTEARPLFLQSLKLNPFYPKVWLGWAQSFLQKA